MRMHGRRRRGKRSQCKRVLGAKGRVDADRPHLSAPEECHAIGPCRTDRWVLEYEPAEAQRPDPLTGWAGSSDTRVRCGSTFRHWRRRPIMRSARALPTMSSRRPSASSSCRPTPTISADPRAGADPVHPVIIAAKAVALQKIEIRALTREQPPVEQQQHLRRLSPCPRRAAATTSAEISASGTRWTMMSSSAVPPPSPTPLQPGRADQGEAFGDHARRRVEVADRLDPVAR